MEYLSGWFRLYVDSMVKPDVQMLIEFGKASTYIGVLVRLANFWVSNSPQFSTYPYMLNIV